MAAVGGKGRGARTSTSQNKPPFIEPRGEADGPAMELVILFLEGVARATTAFDEMADSILPQCRSSPRRLPVAAVRKWIVRWHLNFEDYRIAEPVEMWVFQILKHWHSNPIAARARDVRLSQLWPDRAQGTNIGDDSVPARLSTWNPYRESYTTYATRMRAKFKQFLHTQKAEGEALMDKYCTSPYRMRSGRNGYGWSARFEWLALYICEGYSFAKIAQLRNRKNLSTEDVTKAVVDIAKDLRITLRSKA